MLHLFLQFIILKEYGGESNGLITATEVVIVIYYKIYKILKRKEGNQMKAFKNN